MALGQNEQIVLYINGVWAPGLCVQDSRAINRVSKHPLLLKEIIFIEKLVLEPSGIRGCVADCDRAVIPCWATALYPVSVSGSKPVVKGHEMPTAEALPFLS